MVPMNARTGMLIEELRNNLVAEINGDAILGDSPAKLLTKLHQLSSGTVITENGQTYEYYPRDSQFGISAWCIRDG